MQVRSPGFTFAGLSPSFGDNIEACVVVNAGAIIPPSIERFLIRVMRQAKQLLDPDADAALIRDVEVFNSQEGQHLKLHAEYLAMVRDGGYPRIVEYEAAYAADLNEFLATRSLAWNLSYCEGFEASGAAMAEAWVDGAIRDLCGDHGSTQMRLWMWHLAEEFEHRSAVHDVIDRLYGPDEAFALRTSGSQFNRSHTADHVVAAAAYLHEVNRAGMSSAEVEASQAREDEAWVGFVAASADAMERVFDRDYDPADIPPPRDYEAMLAAFTPR